MATLTTEGSTQSVSKQRLIKRVAALVFRVAHLKKKIAIALPDMKKMYSEELEMREAELAYKGRVVKGS